MHLTADCRMPCGLVSILATRSNAVSACMETLVIIHRPRNPLVGLGIITARVSYDGNRASEVCFIVF